MDTVKTNDPPGRTRDRRNDTQISCGISSGNVEKDHAERRRFRFIRKHEMCSILFCAGVLMFLSENLSVREANQQLSGTNIKNSTSGIKDVPLAAVDSNSASNTIALEPKQLPTPHERDVSSWTHAYSLNSTTVNYTWDDKYHWVPPNGEPYLMRSDIHRIFQSENTLWLGDSTGRQDYHTMYWLMNQNYENGTYPANERLSSLDYVSGNEVNQNLLNKHINVGKKNLLEPSALYCPARNFPASLNHYVQDVGQVAGTGNCSNAGLGPIRVQNIEKGVPISWSNFARRNNRTTGRFDLANARMKCLSEVRSDAVSHRSFLERAYSVVVLSTGIFGPVNKACGSDAAEAVELLDTLHALSGSSLFVVWKLHGPSALAGVDDEAMVTAVRNWFAETQPEHMDLADFRWAVRERSHGKLRLEGDSTQHWGLSARLLSIEIVSRIVERKQERERNGTR